MENSITNRQMFFILLLTLTSISIITLAQVMMRSAGTGSWIPIAVVSVIFAFGVYMIVSLGNMHQGKVFFEYSNGLVGRAGAYVLSLTYTLYFTLVLVDLSLSAATSLRSNFLPKTPVWALELATIPVIGYVAFKGITNVARLFEIYGVIFLIISLSVRVLMIIQGDVNNILPLFIPSEAGKYFKAIKDAIYAFLGIEVLLVIPMTAKNGAKSKRTAFLTLLFIGLFYILLVETSTMMISENEIIHYEYSLIAAIRQVELPKLKFFQRIDILYLTVGFLGSTAGISIVYLSAVEFICRMLPKAKRIAVVTGVGLIAFLAVLLLQNVKYVNLLLSNLIMYCGIATALLIPGTLFVIAKVRKHGKNNT